MGIFRDKSEKPKEIAFQCPECKNVEFGTLE